MKSFTIAPLLVASTLALPELAIQKRDRHTNGATTDFAKRMLLEKRAGTIGTNVYDVLSWSAGGAYYVNVTVGTPPQNQIVILDTGSADLYFDASTAPQCETTGATSCQGGTFNPKDSSTYQVVDPSPAFNTSFGDGSTASGPYSTDVFGIGDVSITNVQFGVAQDVNSTTGYAIGLMGVGYSAIEAVDSAQARYANVPEVLKDSGVINSRLYSVFLNDESNISGSILFGGIDTSKYTGNLVTLDFLPDLNSGYIDQFVTTVTGLSATVSGKSQTLFKGGPDGLSAYKPGSGSLPVLLDTGSTAWSLDQDAYDKYIAPTFPYVDEYGLCDCKYASSSDSVTLEFGGKVQIKVPAREFIVPYINTTTKQPEYLDPNQQEEACLFLISPAPSTGEGFQTLGDAVLRSMYLVYDLDNGQVSIAQANTNNASPNIVTVSAGANGVAKAVSGVSTAPPNSYTVFPAASTSANGYSVSTLSSTIGTATGTNAIPTIARVSGQVVASPSGSSGSGSGSGSGSTSSASPTKNAAPGVVAPGSGSAGFMVTGIAVFFAALGACLI